MLLNMDHVFLSMVGNLMDFRHYWVPIESWLFLYSCNYSCFFFFFSPWDDAAKLLWKNWSFCILILWLVRQVWSSCQRSRAHYSPLLRGRASWIFYPIIHGIISFQSGTGKKPNHWLCELWELIPKLFILFLFLSHG